MEINLELYKKIYLIRRSEEKIIEHYPEDGMKTPMHMSMGEEAIAAGVCHALKPDDQVFCSYRSHGVYLAKTGNTDDFFAELYGKDTAFLKGKGGSMHMCSPDLGFMGSSGIVASAIPVAVGAAFANKRLKTGKYVACFFGDGATDEGVFWESLNVACLMKVPIIFVCEDNDFAVHTPVLARRGYESLIEIVSKFKCNVLQSESTDVEMIYNLVIKGLDLMKETERPLFLQCKYYRYLEHVGINEDFDSGYRSKDEFLNWFRKDPIHLQRMKLLKLGYNTEAIEKIENEIEIKINSSILMAQNAPYCSEDELIKEVIGETN